MENNEENVQGGFIKGARHGSVSSIKAARDTAADVVYYNEDDSGLTFKNKFVERSYNRAKKRYVRKQAQLEKEQKILDNPKEHFPEYVNLKRGQVLKQEIAPIFLTLNPWTVGAVVASAGSSIPAALTSLATSTAGGIIGSNYGAKLDANRHGYTDNATLWGLGAGAIAGGIGTNAGRYGELFVTNKWYNWITHNAKNLKYGISDYKTYGTKPHRYVTYDKGLKIASENQVIPSANLPAKQPVLLNDKVLGTYTQLHGYKVPTLNKVFNMDNYGRIHIGSNAANVDYAVAAPNKDAARWIYRTLSDVIQPGDYIGNDNSTSTLGNRLRIAKTISNGPVDFMRTMTAISDIEYSPTQPGYSPDAYAQILKIGNNKKGPFVVRYAVSPDTKFNNLGKSTLADEITYKQDWNLYTPEKVREYVDFVNNNLIKPNGGDPGWIGLDGMPRFPHPYLMRK